ncbi:hypothetical protein BJ508DRAFT_303926 [Ascobolus immersus RN42]|uniref:Uncharacterized protein n=1 Tax=Ascobolus immersus RN42 TaxID=1160509 RepID=A0A3N4IE99_ASCIM|nr:hypothetical protein BJ508DRAFT_303926 [Ascobolus immersus RN42]
MPSEPRPYHRSGIFSKTRPKGITDEQWNELQEQRSIAQFEYHRRKQQEYYSRPPYDQHHQAAQQSYHDPSSSYSFHRSQDVWNTGSSYAGPGAHDFSYRGRQALNMYPVRNEECSHSNTAFQSHTELDSSARWGYRESGYMQCQDCGSRL